MTQIEVDAAADFFDVVHRLHGWQQLCTGYAERPACGCTFTPCTCTFLAQLCIRPVWDDGDCGVGDLLILLSASVVSLPGTYATLCSTVPSSMPPSGLTTMLVNCLHG
jgi:hypothetical protein